MKKINCDIIKDVLPLYLDGVVSNATKDMVEEHLRCCDSCRKEVEILKQDIIIPTTKNIQLSEARIFKKLKVHFWKKNVFVFVSTMIATILLIIRIDETDGKLYATYQEENLGGTVSLAPSKVTINGKEKNITVFYYYETPWSKYIQPFWGKDDFKNTFYLGDKDDIDQIYYGEFELDGSEINYANIAGNSKLIWGD